MKTINIGKLKPKKIDFKKLKINKKIVILGIVLAIICIFIISMVTKPKQNIINDYTILEKTKITKNVNVLGIVKSESLTNVYTSLSSTIKEVNVEVGQKVKVGDILCVLDSTNLEREVKEATEAITASESNAKIELDNKKTTYDNELYLYENKLNTEIKNAEETLNLAKINFDDKKKAYENHKTLFEAEAITQNDLNKIEIDFYTAKSDYDKAVVQLENTKIKVKESIKNAQNSYEVAKTNYENKSGRISLEGKEQDLGNCQVKASIDGTITSVNAIVGNSSNGILFTIENFDNAIITVDIKEVDIPNIKVGQKTEIKTDATDEMSVEGEVISVNETAKKEQKSEATNNSVSFEAKIKIKELNDNIKVGMTARVNIILEEKDDIYAVSFESIAEDGENKSVYIAEKQENNKYVVKQIPIVVGMESDFKVEISGQGLSDGVIVLNSALVYPVGSEVLVSPNPLINGGEIGE